MTDQIETETFQGVPVRVITRADDRMVPLGDIAAAVGYDARVIRALVDRNADLFEPFEGRIVTVHPSGKGGPQEIRCLTRDGVIGLLMRLEHTRAKGVRSRERIVKFQRWAIDTLGKVMDGRTSEVRTFAEYAAISHIVEDQLAIGASIARNVHVDPGLMALLSLANAEELTGANLTPYKSAIRRSDQLLPAGLLTPTEIGQALKEEIGEVLTPIAVNAILSAMGYQRNYSGKWSLTQSGSRYGEEIPLIVKHDSGRTHAGFQIKWRPEILDKMMEHRRNVTQLKSGGITGYLS